jgi:type II secretory pathway pseudopilin PulG
MTGNKRNPDDSPKKARVIDVAPAKRKTGGVRKLAVGSLICLIVIVIIFVAVVGLYLYPKWTIEGRQSEAIGLLSGIRDAEESYYHQKGSYSMDADELGLTFPPKPNRYEWKITRADDKGFRAEAWGNIDDDGAIDRWEITSKDRFPRNVVNDVEN